MQHTRLDRLHTESGEYFEHLTADGGHAGGASARELAQAILDAGCPMRDDDLAYVRAVAAGERDDDEAA